MLAARQSEESIIQITTMGMGWGGPLQYILDERGHIIRKIGRELTLEEAMAHPFFKTAGLEGRSSVLTSAVKQAQSVEPGQPPVAPPATAPETATVDPLAAVHRKRFSWLKPNLP